MLKKIVNSKSAFTRFFMEADNENQEDKVEVTTKEKAVRPRLGGTDYTKAADAAADAANEEPITADEDGATDYTADAEDTGNADDTNDEADTGTTDDANTDDTANADTGDDAENDNPTTVTADTPDDDDTAAADDGAGDEGTDDDDETATDYTDDVDNGDNGDTAETDNTADSQNQPDEGANDEKLGEKRKKYVMYTRFLKLHNAIDSFVTKLHSIVKDDVTENAVIKIVSNNLIALKNNLYEYMTVKYKDASYVEIHIFYETAINCVRLNFSLLSTNNINIQNN